MKKRIYLLLLITIFTSLSQIKVYAAEPATPVIGYKLSGGVGDFGANTKYYFVESSARSVTHNDMTIDYKPYIDDAMNRWVNTTKDPGVTTPIWFKYTTVQQNSVIDFKAVNNRVLGWSGYTAAIVGSNEVNGRTQDWNWCKVSLNAYYLNFDGMLEDITKASAHEIGHCFGLDDTTATTKSIMYKWLDDIEPMGPSAEDCRAINRIY